MLTVSARSPANIALIKYMGKLQAEGNIPANGSLSMTLDSLCTFAEVRRMGNRDHWVADLPSAATSGARIPKLSEGGLAKVLKHIARMRDRGPAVLARFGLKADYEGVIELRTANTFPSDSGIASSASSFSAITLAVAAAMVDDQAAFAKVWDADAGLKQGLARLSREGSGSSCRSFEGPWVVWEGESAAGLMTPMPPTVNFVLLIKSEPKTVSSSEAHSRVRTSPLWEGRTERANSRLRDVAAALGEANLRAIANITWSEAWEMHSLFHTAARPFTYWEPGTLEALHWLMPFVESAEGIPPIVTIDAGPNVHVMVPESDATLWRQRLHERFPRWTILEDRQGLGARLIS